MFVAEPVTLWRVVAQPQALDDAPWSDAQTMRVAPDEVLVVDGGPHDLADPHAIQMADTSWMQVTCHPEMAAELMTRTASWELPQSGFAQGMVGGMAMKVLVADDVRFFTTRSVIDELLERWNHLGVEAAS